MVGNDDLEKRDDEIAAMVKGMPQFDVPEQLTQRILTSVAEQPARRWQHTNFLTPAAVAATALMSVALPFDTVEGMASMVLCVFALYVIHLVIKSAPTEEIAI